MSRENPANNFFRLRPGGDWFPTPRPNDQQDSIRRLTAAGRVTTFGAAMKLVIQRVRRGTVTVFDSGSGAPRLTEEIGRGLVILVGFRVGDRMDAVAKMARKVLELRIFEDEAGKMNRSVIDISGAVLAVSQFTLYGDTRRGRRPSFTGALPPAEAEPMYRRFVQLLSGSGLRTASGEFGAKMEVEIINDGPVTIILDDDAAQS